MNAVAQQPSTRLEAEWLQPIFDLIRVIKTACIADLPLNAIKALVNCLQVMRYENASAGEVA
jgi:hypothetical protein